MFIQILICIHAQANDGVTQSQIDKQGRKFSSEYSLHPSDLSSVEAQSQLQKVPNIQLV